jgi:hypothetical protein
MILRNDCPAILSHQQRPFCNIDSASKSKIPLEKKRKRLLVGSSVASPPMLFEPGD